MLKLGFWVLLMVAVVGSAYQVMPIYYNNIKVENTFEGVVANLTDSPIDKTKARLSRLLDSQNVDLSALPEEFFENLVINKEEGRLSISSEYHIVVWLLGEPTSIDPDGEYLESDVEFMDKLRLKARLDLDFAPSRITP